MKNWKIYCILLTINIAAGLVSAQTIVDNIILQKDEMFDDFTLNERVSLFTDKSIYITGEKIRFSAATFDAFLQIPVSLSKVLYIELYDQENIPVIQEKIYLENGKGSGMIDLPKEMESNYYYLRAYTNYMKNYGANQFALRQISIVNPYKELRPKIYNSQEQNKVNIRCYPEGGKLVAGMESTVVVRITDSKSEKKDYNGIITDDITNQEVSRFSASDEGFGSFIFMPQKDHSYTVNIFAENKTISEKLPVPAEKGAMIHLDSVSEKFIVMSIRTTNQDILPLQLEAYYGSFKYRVKNIHKDSVTLFIPTSKLPGGFIEFQLKDSQGNEMSKRMVYVPGNQGLGIKINDLKEKYTHREKVVLEIITTDSQGKPVPANLNIAVDLSAGKNDANMRDYILESQLSYYFKNYPPDFLFRLGKDDDFLQMVLITAGNSKPKKEQKTKRYYFAETDADIVTGTLLDINTQNPVSGQKIYQSSIDSIIWLNTCITDSLGRFVFLLGNKQPVNQLIIRAESHTNPYSIEVDDEFYSDYPDIAPMTFFPDEEMLEWIQKAMINAQIKEAYNDNGQKEINRPVTSAPSFYGYADCRYYFDDYIKLPTTEEFIFEIVKEAIIIRRKKEILIRMISGEFDTQIGENPLFLVDGIPFRASQEILDIDPEVLRWIEVVNHRYVYKNDYYDGIFNIKTRTGNFDELELPPNTIRITFVPAKDSKYTSSEINKPTKNNIPNYENVVFWDPTLTTNSKGNAIITLYTPDNSGVFRIRCEGYNENGYWGSHSYSFTVDSEN